MKAFGYSKIAIKCEKNVLHEILKASAALINNERISNIAMSRIYSTALFSLQDNKKK